MIQFSRRPGLVVYLTCGDPTLETTHEVALAAIDAGADVLELGVPFSDPIADGPVIQRASERALAHGTTLEQVLQLGGELRRQRPNLVWRNFAALQRQPAWTALWLPTLRSKKPMNICG